MTTAAKSSLSESEFRIRTAEAKDIDALATLINDAFAVEQIAIEGDRVDMEGVRRYMERGAFLLLEDADSLLGCVYAELRGDRGYAGLVSVRPELQMKGLGRRLMAAAEQYLGDAGCGSVDLRIISARPELLHFYGKLGYAQTGISPMPVDTPLKMACHFIHLSKPLH